MTFIVSFIDRKGKYWILHSDHRKKFENWRPVLHTPLYMTIRLFLSFFWKRNAIKAWNCTHGWKVFLEKHLTYAKHWICLLTSAKTQIIDGLFCWILDHYHTISENWTWWETMAFIFVISRRKHYWRLKNYPFSWHSYQRNNLSSLLCKLRVN